MKKSFLKKYDRLLFMVIITGISIPGVSLAAGPPVASEMSNTMAQVLLAVIGALLLAIILLANVVSGAAEINRQRFLAKQKNDTNKSDMTKTVTVLLLCLTGFSVFAADSPLPAAQITNAANLGGLSSGTLYILLSVIGIELLILLSLLYSVKQLLADEASVTAKRIEKTAPSFSWTKWWEKINSFRPVQEEANIDLGHDYDGIRELDNRLPPWWLYGFYLCILFAVIYLWRFEVSHTAPSSKEELQIAMNEAAIEKEAYLKNAANIVDENTITYLTDAPSLDAGKKIFGTTCIACHLADGGGSVGPNLTDNYWLHGGSIKDIFKTIKYGWPEKGMKSWKDDYSPVQMAQLASFVKSLQGTKPGKPKEQQGVLYEEPIPVVKADSAKKVANP